MFASSRHFCIRSVIQERYKLHVAQSLSRYLCTDRLTSPVCSVDTFFLSSTEQGTVCHATRAAIFLGQLYEAGIIVCTVAGTVVSYKGPKTVFRLTLRDARAGDRPVRFHRNFIEL